MIFTAVFFFSLKVFSLEAHVHGQVKAEISFEVDRLQVNIEAPGDSIVGFETKPKGEKQLKVVEDATNKLRDLSSVLSLTGGDCQQTEHKVEADYDNGHSDFDISYEFSCKKPFELKSIEFNIMKTFTKVKEVEANFVSKEKQDQKILKGKNHTFIIRP